MRTSKIKADIDKEGNIISMSGERNSDITQEVVTPTWIERTTIEKQDLDQKIKALQSSLSLEGSRYNRDTRDLLVRQLDHMQSYSQLLQERLDNEYNK